MKGLSTRHTTIRETDTPSCMRGLGACGTGVDRLFRTLWSRVKHSSSSSSSTATAYHSTSWHRSNCACGGDDDDERRFPEKKYVHVPTHAASSFYATATPRAVREGEANADEEEDAVHEASSP